MIERQACACGAVMRARPMTGDVLVSGCKVGQTAALNERCGDLQNRYAVRESEGSQLQIILQPLDTSPRPACSLALTQSTIHALKLCLISFLS
jgi:hypothetical protein